MFLSKNYNEYQAIYLIVVMNCITSSEINETINFMSIYLISS